MNNALEFTAGQVRAALARVQEATEPAPTRSKAAERTAKWREKQRAAVEAAATQGDATA
jgi:hypothetical protein